MKNKGKHCAKRVVSDTPGLVDFAIGVLNSVLNLPDGQVKYFEETKDKFEPQHYACNTAQTFIAYPVSSTLANQPNNS